MYCYHKREMPVREMKRPENMFTNTFAAMTFRMCKPGRLRGMYLPYYLACIMASANTRESHCGMD